jgi:anthranilate phosphoribosyltransferase
MPLAEVLRELGTEQAWIVHGADGLDEITTTGATKAVSLEGGRITSFEIVPEDAGLPRSTLADIKGGDAAHNAAALTAILKGAETPYRDIALLNAAAALVIAGKVANLREGAAFADATLRSGEAALVLEKLVNISNRSAV